jgi:hypothetical protein
MKVVRVSNGDYQLEVQNGGTITLYTGIRTGQVVVTGNLLVQGTTTTVQSETMTVKDNIIVINKGETGAGVTLTTSGLQVDRGPSTADAQLLFDESVDHFHPTDGNVYGTWSFKRDDGKLVGIQTCSIDTNGGILGLINQGASGFVTVTGTANYERNILTYVDTVTYNPQFGVSIADDDRIPNAKAMGDYFIGSLANFSAESFGAGDTVGRGYDTVRFTGVATFSGFTMTINSVTTGSVKVGQLITGSGITPGTIISAFGTGTGGLGTYTISVSHSLGPLAISIGDSVSKLVFNVDNTLKAQIDVNGLTVNNLNVYTNTLSSTSGNITLTPYDTNAVLNGYLNLTAQGSTPSSSANTNKLYHKSTIGAGDSGLYFTNTTRSDELVSKRRAILFGMIF